MSHLNYSNLNQKILIYQVVKFILNNLCVVLKNLFYLNLKSQPIYYNLKIFTVAAKINL